MQPRQAYAARANVLSLLGRDADADQSFLRATALGPGLRDAWYYDARFLFARQRYAEGSESLSLRARGPAHSSRP